MSAIQGFYYNKQLRNYLIQFMSIFAGMKVQVGKAGDTEPRVITVPIKNASKDRVVAAIKSENTQNKPIRLPLFSAWLLSVNLAPEMRKGIGQVKRQTYLPTGGMLPDDIKVVEHRQPVPYVGMFELGIWASNQDQHYQILEQILTLFDPILQIQTSDGLFDTTKLTYVELKDIRFDENLPPGGDRRIIQTTLQFDVPMYLSIPVTVHSRYVQDIFTRVGIVSQISQKSEDIVAELDAQGIEYDHNFSLENIDINN